MVVFLNSPQALVRPKEIDCNDGYSRKVKDEKEFKLGRSALVKYAKTDDFLLSND